MKVVEEVPDLPVLVGMLSIPAVDQVGFAELSVASFSVVRATHSTFPTRKRWFEPVRALRQLLCSGQVPLV